jgi:GntR family transcriptional regulator
VLNPSSPLPLYHQLADLLMARIERGDLSPGAKLPSEPELSRTHSIGRPTVRQATELLVQRGLIERRRGSGTFVREAPRKVDVFSLAGTLSSFARGGAPLEATLLERVSRREVDRDPENPFSGRPAFSFMRVGRVAGDRTPVLVEHIFLDPDVFPDLPRVPLAGASLSRIVEERYYLRPTHAEQSFRVAIAPPRVRDALELGKRDPVLLVKRTLHFPRVGKAIFAEIYCRTGDFVFAQTIGTETFKG